MEIVWLESCCKVISDHAFKQKVNDLGVPNHKDPLFIGLNLNTNKLLPDGPIALKSRNEVINSLLSFLNDH